MRNEWTFSDTVSDMVLTSTLKWEAIYEGRCGSNASYFFLRNCNYSYNEIYIYLGHVLLKTSDHFPQSPSLSAQFFHLYETQYASRVKLFADPDAHCVSDERNGRWRMLNQDYRADDNLICLPVSFVVLTSFVSARIALNWLSSRNPLTRCLHYPRRC